jgi:hypothetical protein
MADKALSDFQKNYYSSITEYLKKLDVSMTNVQQNMELLSVFVVNTNTRKPLLSMMSMEEVRMFASFEETIRCLDSKNKYYDLRMTSMRRSMPVFAFIDGRYLVKHNSEFQRNLQYGDDMSSCVYIEQLFDDQLTNMIAWKNLQTGEVVLIRNTAGFILNIVLSKNGKICVGTEISLEGPTMSKNFVVQFDAFPEYRFKYVELSPYAHRTDTLLQFMDHDSKMLMHSETIDIKVVFDPDTSMMVTKQTNSTEFLLKKTSMLFNEDDQMLHHIIPTPYAGCNRALFGDPCSGLVAWYSMYSIGLYNCVTKEATTLKHYDKHKPEMVIGIMQDVKIAFSKRYVAFVFQLNRAADDCNIFGGFVGIDCRLVIIVCDTMEKMLYETQLSNLNVIESCQFMNDHDYLIISTRHCGMKVWDFKNKDQISDLQFAHVDIVDFRIKTKRFKLHLTGQNGSDADHAMSFDVRYTKPHAPFSKGAPKKDKFIKQTY